MIRSPAPYCACEHALGGCSQQSLQQQRAIGRAQSCAGIPTGAGAVAAIVAAGHIAQCLLLQQLGVMLIEERVQVPNGLTASLIEQGNQPGPQRSHCARAPHGSALTVDNDLIACLRVRIACDIGYPAPLVVVVDGWQKIAPDAVDARTALRSLRKTRPPEKEALGVYVFEVEQVTD